MSVYVGTRDVVTAVGSDAAEYLQGQISQDVDSVAVGASRWSLVLAPQGKVDALFRLTRAAEDRFHLDVDAGWGEPLRARLQRFLLRMDVTFELETWDHHAYRGSRPDPPAAAVIAAPVEWLGQPGVDLLGPHLDDPAADVERLDDAGYRRLRIEAGVPVMGSELDDTTIPAEAGDVDQWVSFTKGCYTGQELVARIDSRGSRTPRSLHRLRGGGAAPDPGTPIAVDGQPAGSLTSVAPTEDGWVALGYLKRGIGADADADVAGSSATIEALRPAP